MSECDLIIRGGTVVTAGEQFRADIGVREGRITLIGDSIRADAKVIEADGLLVMPGGVDSHCHIEQLRPNGGTDEETFVTGSRSAFAGGTTTVVTFSTQFKGHTIGPSLAEYQQRAQQAMVDYAFHQIVSDPTDEVLAELPEIVASGIRSFKVFLTYDAVHLDDRQYLRVLAAARRTGALVTVHCENYDAIAWRTQALMDAGMTSPKYHAWARPSVVEREATHRAIALAELVGQAIQVFHVSCPEVAEEIARARRRGLPVWGETCPQCLVLSAGDMDRPGFEGAKFMCSPAPRDAAASAGMWDAIRARHDRCRQLRSQRVELRQRAGQTRQGRRRAVPRHPQRRARARGAIADRVQRGRGERPHRCVRVRAAGVDASRRGCSGCIRARAPSRRARMRTLFCGTPAKRVTLTNALMQHAIDYTPYEGLEVTGWPVMTIRRGAVVMQDGQRAGRTGQRAVSCRRTV